MTELEDLLVRTLHDPARALPAPADPVPAIVARARTQRRHAALGLAAVVLVTVAALVVPMSLRRSDPLPPASTDQGLLDWPPRGAFARDAALVAAAERSWRDSGPRRPAGAVALLWAGRIGGERTVLLQGRDGAGAALVALTAGDPQRVVRVDPLPDPGTAAVRLAVGTATFLLLRPDAASVFVLEDWGSSRWAERVPADGVVPGAPEFAGWRLAVADTGGRLVADGTVAADGSLPLVRGPVRLAAPTWRRARIVPLGSHYADGRLVAERLGGAGPVDLAPLEDDHSGKPADLYGDNASSRLYEVRRDGRTWLASVVREPWSGDAVQCLRVTEITGRVAATAALVTRCRPPGSPVGTVRIHLADGVRLTGVTLAAAGPGERTWRYAGEPVGGRLTQQLGADFPTGAGRVTLADAAGRPLPPVQVPPYS